MCSQAELTNFSDFPPCAGGYGEQPADALSERASLWVTVLASGELTAESGCD